MRLGIRDDRISSSKFQDRTALSKSIGFECIEIIVDQPPHFYWMKNYKSELPIVSACMDYWFIYDWISCINESQHPIDIEAKYTTDCRIMFPCYGKSILNSRRRVSNLKSLLLSVDEDRRKNIVIEANNKISVMLDLCETCGVGLCYDLGNEKTLHRGKIEDIEKIVPYVRQIHLKHREMGSFVTEHLPENNLLLLWYRKRIHKFIECGYTGDIILETPKGNRYQLNKNYNIARGLMENK